MSAITRYLPRRTLSRIVGAIMHWRGPAFWAKFTVKTFADHYKINLDEAERPWETYQSIGDLFTRRLKSGARPIANAAAVHPADSEITQWGPIHNGELIQAKGITYDLVTLTRDPDAEKKWALGGFVTYYLCPTDYHRVHSPVRGFVHTVRYIPGDLWPVNDWSTKAIQKLFCINERVLVEIDTEFGPVAVIFVGATNVGQIGLSFDDLFSTNKVGVHDEQVKHYLPTIPVSQGSELGVFKMGSTVVVLYPPDFWKKHGLALDTAKKARVGEALTR